MRQPVRPRTVLPAGASWNVYGSDTPAGISYSTDTVAYTLATAFTVDQSALSLTQIRIYFSSGGGSIVASDVASVGSPIGARLYAGNLTSDGAIGATLISSVSLTSVTLDAWNMFTLESPYGLTSGNMYYAAVWLPSGRYSLRSGEFSTSGVSNGPITFPVNGAAQGTSGTVRNGAFLSLSDAAPYQSTGAWYGIDVQVSA